MTNPCSKYELQYKKAKETLAILKVNQAEIDLKLQTDSISADLHKKLRTVNLEIKITLNELEQAEDDIQQCELQFKLKQNTF
ncbi:hypothetical protein [Flavobacterium hiemivividum]|uniref:Uncharacterized protein n=1 Tax=Flavobacterium hiemivividum TaxID=2541734 RepID=A0A4R5CU05_9FLAO|nr:hypothetical protein [Flavobacterium hiemivividum]TDE01954.1 hypothetical protein E0F98_14050 [Flavobacterium hiemivividum]